MAMYMAENEQIKLTYDTMPNFLVSKNVFVITRVLIKAIPKNKRDSISYIAYLSK